MDYQLFHLKDHKNSMALTMIKKVQVLGHSEGVNTWGIFPGLFGLATNELYWVVISDDTTCPIELNDGIELCQHVTLSPTVRPVEHEPRSQEGVYVFRWFDVDNVHIPEVVTLSDEAWQTFEGGFDTQVQGLFTTRPQFDIAKLGHAMVLVTWYKSLAVWQDSRTPDERAKRRFMQRQALMNSATPIATRLVTAT